MSGRELEWKRIQRSAFTTSIIMEDLKLNYKCFISLRIVFDNDDVQLLIYELAFYIHITQINLET